jgi:hypothetical protein
MSDGGLYAQRRRVPTTGWSSQDRRRRDLDTDAAQTLGEALLLSMSEHGHTNKDAAAWMVTARANVSQWTKDLIDPLPENYGVLTQYLDVELDALGVLIIYSQMRRAELRNERAPTVRGANAVDH